MAHVHVSPEVRTAAAIVLGFVRTHPLCDECCEQEVWIDALDNLVRGNWDAARHGALGDPDDDQLELPLVYPDGSTPLEEPA
jgi:hypothetical protein